MLALNNVNIVHGDFEHDLDKVSELASSHPIVINAASAMMVPLTEAVISGIRSRPTTSGRAILIHLSGTGNFARGSSGSYDPTLPVFHDSSPNDVRAVDATYLPNGPCDEVVIAAGAAGVCNVFILAPSGVYGLSKDHPGNHISPKHASASAPGVWMDWMLRNITNLGFSPYVNEGTSIFRTIHVDDTVRLLLLVYEHAIKTLSTYTLEDVYKSYFVGVDETHKTKDVAQMWAKYMSRKGEIKEGEARSVIYEEAGIVAKYLGGNMLVDDKNAKALGFVPKAPGLEEVLKSM